MRLTKAVLASVAIAGGLTAATLGFSGAASADPPPPPPLPAEQDPGPPPPDWGGPKPLQPVWAPNTPVVWSWPWGRWGMWINGQFLTLT